MKSRQVATLLAGAFWTLFGLITGIQVWISMLHHGHSVPLLLGYYIIVWLGWFPITVAVAWLQRRWSVIPLQRFSLLVHTLAAFVFAVVHFFYWLALLVTMRPFDVMQNEPSQVDILGGLFYRLPLELLLYCLSLGGVIAYDYYERYRASTVEAAQLQRSLTDARIHALERQIQPHFLFNTLNAITSLVRSKRNEEAVSMMVGLSEILRYTLDHEAQFVTLDKELSILERYLEINRTRFPDRMSWRIDVPFEVTKALVPAFVLQPLAENAIRHGIAGSAGAGTLLVRAERDGALTRVEIFNTGRLQEPVERGIGLQNTVQRLQHLYGTDWSFDLANAEGGVRAVFTIPWRTA